MIKLTSSLLFATLLGLCLHVASAQAQYIRTCVSANGNDANTCHCSTPCRTFQKAHDQTLADGEITVLDPGGYGPVTITKSISIVNDGGGEAGISVSGDAAKTTGITVNAQAGQYVNLRGLTIQGVGFGVTTGLRFNTGRTLTITNCVIRNHIGNGIDFLPTASSTLAVSNTLVADNSGDGIRVQPSGSGTVKAAFDQVEAYNNSQQGIIVLGNSSTGTIMATAADSVAANNVNSGFVVNSGAGLAATSLMLIRSVAANNNNVGVSAVGAAATVRIGQSTVTGNASGWSQVSGGVLRSYGDNNIDGNTVNEGPPTTIVLK
jgi:hypothetical protein